MHQQIQPQQAFALWGQRGWGTQEGVWKTYHDVGLIASVCFRYGGGTPLDVEGLTIDGLEKMVKLLQHYGWKPTRNPLARRESPLPALRMRCVEAASKLENGDKRLAGLALKICGTAQLAWCKDPQKLERLLAVLGNIKREE